MFNEMNKKKKIFLCQINKKKKHDREWWKFQVMCRIKKKKKKKKHIKLYFSSSP